jgi:hypothetical protein
MLCSTMATRQAFNRALGSALIHYVYVIAKNFEVLLAKRHFPPWMLGRLSDTNYSETRM